MATVYYFTDHKYEAQLHYPYRHLGVVVYAISHEPFYKANLHEGVDIWHEGRVYDNIAYDTFTLTSEAFKRLEESGVEIFRNTRANRKLGIRKMNVDIWLKEEDARIKKVARENLWKELHDKCSMQDILEAAVAMIPDSRIDEFMKICISNSCIN